MTRARARTRVKFKNAQNDLKRTLVCTKSDFEHFLFLTRAYAHFLTRKRVYYLDRILGLNVKFMCSEYGLVMIYGYDDKIERVILQNGVQIMTRLSDHNEKGLFAIPGHTEYAGKIIDIW